MAGLTLTEMAKLSQRELEPGVLLNIANFDPILSGGSTQSMNGATSVDESTDGSPRALPFITVNGKTYDYVRENSRGTAHGWEAISGALTSSAMTFSEVSVTMRYFYDQVDVPNPLRDNYMGDSGNNIDQIALRQALRRIAAQIADNIYYGSNSADADSPDGLHLSADSTMLVEENGNSATSAALQFASLDTLLQDYMKFGASLLIMPRILRRRLAAASRSTTVSGTIDFNPNQLGQRAFYYDNTLVEISDYLVNTELYGSDGVFSAKTGGAASSVWAVKFGDTFLHGVQRNPGIQVEYFPRLEGSDDARWRFKWYLVPVVRKSIWAAGAVTNVDSATAIIA